MDIVSLGISGLSSDISRSRVRQDFDTDAVLPEPDEQNVKQANAVTRLGHDLSQHGKLVKPQRVGVGAERLSLNPRLYCSAVDHNHRYGMGPRMDFELPLPDQNPPFA